MTDSIEPALTSEQWIARVAVDQTREDGACYIYDGEFGVGVDTYFMAVNPVEAIALANAALPEGDLRKLTRKRVSDLKDVAGLARDALRVYGPESLWGNVPRTLAAMIDRTEALADVLASYLPPEGT